MNKYMLFPLIAFLFVQPKFYGCSAGNNCANKYESALIKFFETYDKKDATSFPKARNEIGNFMEKCNFPEDDIEIYMMGTFKEHHLAILSSNAELLENLIRTKDIDDTGLAVGMSSLHLAAAYSTKDVLELLVNSGYELNSLDELGGTPLISAVELNNIPNVHFLIGKGADINIVARSGWSALSIAVMGSNLEVARELIEKGASVCLKDVSGRTIFDLTEKKKNKDLFLLLEREYQKQSCDSLSRHVLSGLSEALHREILCPKVQPFFGSFSLCSASYDVQENLVIFYLGWSPDSKMNLPLDEWEDSGKTKAFLEEMICNGVAGSLGISDNAILSNHAGIIKELKGSEPNGTYLSRS